MRAAGEAVNAVHNGTAGVADYTAHTPSDCGIFQLALSVAIYLPEASGAGFVSTSSPVVICAGAPPATGTAQIWRRSMSFAFVQY